MSKSSFLFQVAIRGLIIAGIAQMANSAPVFFSSEKAKVYHVKLECSGLRRAVAARTARTADESLAAQHGLKLCTRCNKPKSAAWSKLIAEVSK